MKFYGAALFLTHTVMVMTADTCGGCGDGAYASSRVLRRIEADPKEILGGLFVLL